jgi:hypothetical protein
MRFRNFHIWRGRLPHWRADGVTYYATFRHRRDLVEDERRLLLEALLRPDGRKWDLRMLLVLPRETHLIFAVRPGPAGAPYELAKVLEPAKAKAARQIMRRTGERYPPFWNESYDRIVRDAEEMRARWDEVVAAAAPTGQDGDIQAALWLADPPGDWEDVEASGRDLETP